MLYHLMDVVWMHIYRQYASSKWTKRLAKFNFVSLLWQWPFQNKTLLRWTSERSHWGMFFAVIYLEKNCVHTKRHAKKNLLHFYRPVYAFYFPIKLIVFILYFIILSFWSSIWRNSAATIITPTEIKPTQTSIWNDRKNEQQTFCWHKCRTLTLNYKILCWIELNHARTLSNA